MLIKYFEVLAKPKKAMHVPQFMPQGAMTSSERWGIVCQVFAIFIFSASMA